MANWIFGIFALIAGLVGALMAARALDVGVLTFGLGLVVFAVFLIFWLIKDHYDQQERSQP